MEVEADGLLRDPEIVGKFALQITRGKTRVESFHESSRADSQAKRDDGGKPNWQGPALRCFENLGVLFYSRYFRGWNAERLMRF